MVIQRSIPRNLLFKVEQTEPWQRVDNDVFEQDLDALASRLLETRRMQICNPENGETGETEGCQVARRLHRKLLSLARP